VCAFHWPTPDPEPPDPGPWGSIPNRDEFISDHIHTVLHQAHFTADYVESEAESLNSYLDICNWQMYSILSNPEDVSVAHVEPIQCHMSCSPQGGTDFTLLFDTGATHSFTNNIDDFVTDLQTETMSVVRFIGNDTTVMGSGAVQWTVHGSNGKTTTIRAEAYYVPAGHRRLFCPQRHVTNWECFHELPSPGSFAVQATQCHFVDNLGEKIEWSMISLPEVQAT
jgi:hypothetical protein